MTRPLEGITVIELGASIAAPYGTWILGNLGADVIKIERPGKGDDARGWGKHYHGDISLWFHSINLDKKSITVDLKDADDVDALRAFIAEKADVVVQNHKPGRVESLGLDAKTLLKLNPRLVYCNIGAFGREGPLNKKPGYDPMMQAFGGPMSVTGHPGQAPVRTGFSAIDMGTGMWCAIGVLSAIHRRTTTGLGGEVDTALFETAVGWTQLVSTTPLNGGPVPGPFGSGVEGIVPYQAYRCKDGFLILGCGNDILFEKLCAVLDRPEWMADERFNTNRSRINHRDELNAILEKDMAQHDRAHWVDVFDAAGIPNAPTQDLGEVVAHPQTSALDLIQTLEGGLKTYSLPLSFDGKRPHNTKPGPAVGADTEALLGPFRKSGGGDST